MTVTIKRGSFASAIDAGAGKARHQIQAVAMQQRAAGGVVRAAGSGRAFDPPEGGMEIIKGIRQKDIVTHDETRGIPGS